MIWVLKTEGIYLETLSIPTRLSRERYELKFLYVMDRCLDPSKHLWITIFYYSKLQDELFKAANNRSLLAIIFVDVLSGIFSKNQQ